MKKGKGTTASVVIPGIQEESHEKVIKKEIITVAILMAAAVAIFAGILNRRRHRQKNAPSFIFQRSGITPMISGLR